MVVLVLAMGLFSSIASSLGMIPEWFRVVENRVAAKREAQIARAFFLMDLKDAKSLSLLSTDSFKIVLSSKAEEITYSLGDVSADKSWRDLYRASNKGSTVRVATLVQSMSCSVPSADSKGLDVCVLFGKAAPVRRSILSCRVAK